MSLKKELGKRLLTDMIRSAKGSDPAIVLVVDPHTSKILSSCLRMYDIMEQGVLVLQNLFLVREKLPDLPAIYFIDPTPECIEKLIADFPTGALTGTAAEHAKYAQKAQYLNAHLYFTSHVPDVCMKMLKGAPIMKKIKSFVEMNVDFLAFESRVFLFDQPQMIPRLYFSNDHLRLSAVLSAISKPLVSLCITFNEYPHVRYSALGKSGICKGLASFFDIDMKKTVSQLSNWKMNEARERGTLLIVDRSIDPIAPLMHEYTFQAMVNDLLPVSGEIVELPAAPVSSKGANGAPKTAAELDAEKAASEVVLSEDDSLWMDFRHKHIGSVMVEVTQKFKEFKGVNKMAVLQQDDKSSVKDMIQAMKDMPEYKNMMKKYHKHMSLAQECMTRVDNAKLTKLSELEQDMATGLNNEAKSISMKDVKDRLVQLCQDPSVDVLDKIRLVMIYMISQGGMQEATRRELMKSVDVSLQDAIRNLDALGVDLSSSDKNKKKMSKERTDELKNRNLDQKMALMRYLPAINSVIEQLVTGQLKEENFPYTSPPPPGSAPAPAATSARKGVSARKKPTSSDWKSGDSSSSSSSSAVNAEDDLRPRFFIFVLGGVTFSEMRTAYELAEKHGVNLYIGSTNTITPTEYIQDLSNLSPVEFQRAVDASSSTMNRTANILGAAAPTSAGQASASAQPAARRPIAHDSDSDDDAPPVNLHKLNVRV